MQPDSSTRARSLMIRVRRSPNRDFNKSLRTAVCSVVERPKASRNGAEAGPLANCGDNGQILRGLRPPHDADDDEVVDAGVDGADFCDDEISV